MNSLNGIFSALVTPFSEAGASVDVDGLGRLIDHTVDSGIDGVVLCASTGEFATLSSEDRRRVVEVGIERVEGRVPVIVNTGSMSTLESVELSRHAEAAGASAVMAVAPYYEPIELDEVRSFYEAVAVAVEVPIVVYNIPGATGVNLPAEFVAGLGRDIPNVRYVKESSGDAIQLARLITRHADDITVFNGIDLFLLPALQLGAKGAIIGATNFLAPECAAITAASRAGDQDTALELWGRVVPVMLGLLDQGSYPAAVKAACELRGLEVGDPRAPLAPLDGPGREHLAELMPAVLAENGGSGA